MRRGTKRLLVTLAVLALLLVAARVALDPLVTWRTRKILRRHGRDARTLPGRPGERPRPLVLDRGLAHREARRGRRALPYFQVRKARGSASTSRSSYAGTSSRRSISTSPSSRSSARRTQQEQGVEEAPEVGLRASRTLAPFRMDRLQVKDGELLWVDASEPERRELWLHRIEGTLENFATRKALSKNEPTRPRGARRAAALRGRLGVRHRGPAREEAHLRRAGAPRGTEARRARDARGVQGRRRAGRGRARHVDPVPRRGRPALRRRAADPEGRGDAAGEGGARPEAEVAARRRVARDLQRRRRRAATRSRPPSRSRARSTTRRRRRSRPSSASCGTRSCAACRTGSRGCRRPRRRRRRASSKQARRALSPKRERAAARAAGGRSDRGGPPPPLAARALGGVAAATRSARTSPERTGGDAQKPEAPDRPAGEGRAARAGAAANARRSPRRCSPRAR